MDELKIRTIENGYLLTTFEEMEDENGECEIEPRYLAYTYGEDPMKKDYDEEHCKALKNLLYEIMEQLGFWNSKHHDFRVNIEIEDQREVKKEVK